MSRNVSWCWNMMILHSWGVFLDEERILPSSHCLCAHHFSCERLSSGPCSCSLTLQKAFLKTSCWLSNTWICGIQLHRQCFELPQGGQTIVIPLLWRDVIQTLPHDLPYLLLLPSQDYVSNLDNLSCIYLLQHPCEFGVCCYSYIREEEPKHREAKG